MPFLKNPTILTNTTEFCRYFYSRFDSIFFNFNFSGVIKYLCPFSSLAQF